MVLAPRLDRIAYPVCSGVGCPGGLGLQQWSLLLPGQMRLRPFGSFNSGVTGRAGAGVLDQSNLYVPVQASYTDTMHCLLPTSFQPGLL